MKQCPLCQLTYPNESAFCFVEGSPLLVLPDPRIGVTLAGRYVLEREIGVGGMATVYGAHHKLVERPCAIKILSAEFAQDPVLRERFVREAKHAQRIAHPNVIEIYDQGETPDGSPFLVMELLEGRSLADVIAEGPLPLARTLPIAIQMMRALGRAHDFEVIHRDLKPENVFLLAGDHVKLLDFGIARCAQDARLTTMGEIFGTPQYMAPERGQSIDAGPAADLYAFGIMLFEMLTGGLPFEAENPALWLLKHLKETPPHLRRFVPRGARGARPARLRSHGQGSGRAARRRPPRPGVAGDHRPGAHDPHPRRAEQGGGAALDGAPVGWATPGSAGSSSSIACSPAPIPHPRAGRPGTSCARSTGSAPSSARSRACGRARSRSSSASRPSSTRAARGASGSAGRWTPSPPTPTEIREEARALRARVGPLGDASRAFTPRVMAAHKELVVWEGRSGFREPHRELAAAYRALADLVDAWVDARRCEIDAEGEAVQKERAVADVDFQIRSLRESLSQHDRSFDERRRVSQERIAEMGNQTQAIEDEMLRLASYFCAPLRPLPALAPLFFELERAAPVAPARMGPGPHPTA